MKRYVVILLLGCTSDISRPEMQKKTTPCEKALVCFANYGDDCHKLEGGALAGEVRIACNAVHPNCESLEKQCYGE